MGKSTTTNVDNATEADEDEDDFIMNVVKRRLKEMRWNNFIVLILEETCPQEGELEEEEEDEGKASSNEWRGVEVEGRKLCSSIYSLHRS